MFKIQFQEANEVIADSYSDAIQVVAGRESVNVSSLVEVEEKHGTEIYLADGEEPVATIIAA